MMPNWLVRLNDFLTWLNPMLGLTAAVLAAMVAAAAADRLPVQPRRPAAPATHALQQPVPAACPPVGLPPEWRELSRYD